LWPPSRAPAWAQPAESYGYTGLEQLCVGERFSVAFGYDPADNLARLRGATQAFDVGQPAHSLDP
jgi:hypothetical protein